VTSAPRDIEQLRHSIARGLRPKLLFFWGHTGSADGSIGKECFSQWYPSPFELGGKRFVTAEHYMMWSKATLFGDREAAGRVLAAKDPDLAKRLGRSVNGFDEPTWQAQRFAIVVRGNIAKFEQAPLLRDYLLQTGERVLVEASPVDRIWGIGVTADDPRANDPARWQGLNLLGFALMQARAELARALVAPSQLPKSP
jgi:ribA/ribD-fused uncharacterized protein